MRDFFDRLFAGRHGMDQLSKALFWAGLALFALSLLTAGLGALSNFIFFMGIFLLIYAFIRAFSRRIQTREMENYLFLNLIARQKLKVNDWKERRRQSKDFCFFKCPGCKTMLRVPRGKGKIHIKCKCGYTLYRKT